MAYAEQTTSLTRAAANSRALAREWRRMTRWATGVALCTAPAFFLILHVSSRIDVAWSLVLTVLVVIAFRGLVEVTVRRLIPSPSLFGTGEELKQDDIVARRRWWYWRTKWRRVPLLIVVLLALLGLCQALFAFAGVSASFFDPFPALRQVFPVDELPQFALLFIQIPFILLINILVFMGPFIFMAIRGIHAYEPGDASWGVRLEDVRGQAEAKEDIARVITLWQSGEEFERAGGKRERGLLFLGAPGTGKTMISKAIATSFNCPFVTIPGSGFAQMFIGMDALTVQLLAYRSRKLARKWGGQCIVFIDEIDAVGMRRQALQPYAAPAATPDGPGLFFGPQGALTPTGDVIVEGRQWRDQLFAQRSAPADGPTNLLARVAHRVNAAFPGMGGMGYQGQALNQLLVVMDGMGQPPAVRKWLTNKVNTFLDAMFVIPQRLGSLSLRLPPPTPRKEEIYFIGACNVPIETLDPALTRPGRMGRHIWFRTPTAADRKDIFDLYMAKVDHEPDLDTGRRRDELARITNGYSPSMIEQCCSMALTIAHAEGRPQFAWRDIVEAMTTVESGTAQNIEYMPEETRAVAIHEAGHAVAGHVFTGEDLLSTRLSIKKRGGSLGHYQSMERDERFSHFRGYEVGRLIMILGAMAAEHVFYGENSQGVSGDLYSATATAAAMVGMWGMGPDAVAMAIKPPEGRNRNGNGNGNGAASDGGQRDDIFGGGEDDRTARRLQLIGGRLMNRASIGSAMMGDQIAAVLSDRGKHQAAAQLLGEAYVTAYTTMLVNRDRVERVAQVLMERRELHGDEVVDLLDGVGLVRPRIDLTDDRTWPVIASGDGRSG